MVVLLNSLSLAFFHRCSAVADDAAAALALFVVAGEIFCKDLLRNEAIVNLDNCSVIHSYLSIIYSTLVVDDRGASTALTFDGVTASIFDAYDVVKSFPSRYLFTMAWTQ